MAFAIFEGAPVDEAIFLFAAGKFSFAVIAEVENLSAVIDMVDF
jgi:hypothetical protein